MKITTKNEFLTQFADELAKRGVDDRDDVLEEYRQHFDFKMADGYTQEEIAAKLGTPAGLRPSLSRPKPPANPVWQLRACAL